MIHIRLNGEDRKIPPEQNLASLLAELKLNPLQVAVAKNLEVIVRSELEQTQMQDGDQIEIFHAVGGG